MKHGPELGIRGTAGIRGPPSLSRPGRGALARTGRSQVSRNPATAMPGGQRGEAARHQGHRQQVQALGHPVAEVDPGDQQQRAERAAAPARWRRR